MSVEVQESLFDIDSKTHSTVGTNSERGSGMGLSLCSDFIRRNGGQIMVSSKENAGSTFSITLPVGSVEAQHDEILEKINGWTVLVVEDNPLHQITTKQALQSLGMHVLLAENGKKAVEMAVGLEPDLILMDYDLPDFVGDVVMNMILEKIRKAPKHIIALTSYSKMELANKATGTRFDGYLHKPLKCNELLDCL